MAAMTSKFNLQCVIQYYTYRRMGFNNIVQYILLTIMNSNNVGSTTPVHFVFINIVTCCSFFGKTKASFKLILYSRKCQPSVDVPNSIIGGGAHIHIFTFCTVNFVRNRLFSWSVNSNT